jgi:hypothetical protein
LLVSGVGVTSRVIARFLLKQAGVKRIAADTGAVTVIQRFGSAANLSIHPHCLVLDGVNQRTEGEPDFQEARTPTHAELEAYSKSIRRHRLLSTCEINTYGTCSCANG